MDQNLDFPRSSMKLVENIECAGSIRNGDLGGCSEEPDMDYEEGEPLDP